MLREVFSERKRREEGRKRPPASIVPKWAHFRSNFEEALLRDNLLALTGLWVLVVEEDQENAVAADFTQHFPKPINLLQLLEIVVHLAGRDR